MLHDPKTVIGSDFDQETAEKIAPPFFLRLELANCRTSWRTFYRFAEDSKRIALLPPSRSDLCKGGDWIKPLGVLRRRAKLLNFNLVLFFFKEEN